MTHGSQCHQDYRRGVGETRKMETQRASFIVVWFVLLFACLLACLLCFGLIFLIFILGECCRG